MSKSRKKFARRPKSKRRCVKMVKSPPPKKSHRTLTQVRKSTSMIWSGRIVNVC